MKNFTELNLSEPLAKAVAEMGYETPTPIQSQTIPMLLGDKTDFLGMAATGTGKTAAFGIPLIERLDPSLRATQAIVLCPTRELAAQVAGQLDLIGKHKRIAVQPIYGGAGYGEQIAGMKRGAAVIVATPGRLIDHLEKGTLVLDNVSTVVLDEADEMVSMGFKEELETLLKGVGPECNRWMFAATMSSELRRVADRYLRKPKLAQINRTEMLSGTVRQVYYTVREKNKTKGLCKIIDMTDNFYGIIFCQTKALVVTLTEYMRARGYRVDCLHGDKSQAERERTLRLFREKNTTMLVCSDVAARGLDVKDLTHVINYSLPLDLDSYVHRIGRTGRSGAQGLALSLVAPTQSDLIARIERITKSKMEQGNFPTRKAISVKRMTELLPKFSEVLGHEKAAEILNDDWKAKLADLSKEEIAARFLAMAFPDLFDDRELAEEVGLKERETTKPRRERRHDGYDRHERFEDRDGEPGERPRRPFRPPFGAKRKPFFKRANKPFRPHPRRDPR